MARARDQSRRLRVVDLNTLFALGRKPKVCLCLEAIGRGKRTQQNVTIQGTTTLLNAGTPVSVGPGFYTASQTPVASSKGDSSASLQRSGSAAGRRNADTT